MIGSLWISFKIDVSQNAPKSISFPLKKQATLICFWDFRINGISDCIPKWYGDHKPKSSVAPPLSVSSSRTWRMVRGFPNCYSPRALFFGGRNVSSDSSVLSEHDDPLKTTQTTSFTMFTRREVFFHTSWKWNNNNKKLPKKYHKTCTLR